MSEECRKQVKLSGFFINQKNTITMLIKLTNIKDETILIGIESIIDAKEMYFKSYDSGEIWCTKIQSRGAMVETNYVKQSVEEIWDMAQMQKENIINQ